MSNITSIDILDLKGVHVGHAQDEEAGTGCTVILVPDGAVGGVDVRGGAPATRETDLLHPVNLIDGVHAVVLSGGSAYGLDAAGGVMRFLEERNIGFAVGPYVVPIVCGASLFDLFVGDGRVRPDADMGYRACEQAMSGGAVREGNAGAGTGATVGKYMGPERMMKSGIGWHVLTAGSLQVAAIIAVNAMGDVYDVSDGTPLAGVRSEDGRSIDSTERLIVKHAGENRDVFAGNTTIGCVITNASLTKSEATKLAQQSHNGYADVIRPVHTLNDGDSVFALALGRVQADPLAVGVLARKAVASAVNRAVRQAAYAFGVPGSSDL